MPEAAARRSDTTSVECSGNALQSSDTGRVDVAHHGNDVGGELIRFGAVAGGAVGSCFSLLPPPAMGWAKRPFRLNSETTNVEHPIYRPDDRPDHGLHKT